MKISSLLALFTVCAPFAAHAQTNIAPDALPMAPKSAATADAFVWRFMPPVGSRWTMRSFTRAVSVGQMPATKDNKAASMKFTMIQKLTADYDVLSRDALGATTIRLTLRNLKSDVTMVSDGKTIKSPLAKNANPNAANGATLTVKQSSDGKVWGVVGMRAFQRKIFEASGVGDAATINTILDANPMTKDSEMVKSMSMMAGTLPTSPVRLGESWTYNVSLPQPLSFDISGTRTIKALDSEVAVVADSATYTGGKSEMKMPTTPQMGNFSMDFSKLIGVVNGVSRVQRSSGLPLESTSNQTLKGSITTKIPASKGVAAQNLTVPINAISSARVVLEPRG